LTTDFGSADAYAAAMKGVILDINPDAMLVDICHTIEPQSISQAAFVLGTVYEFFPQRTIHLVVVDPGVGTARRAIILRTPQADFVAPDNGVLSYVIQQYSIKTVDFESKQSEIAPGLEAVAITNPKLWRSPVSPTFHGRDIFAPVAAYLSTGLPLADFGEVISSIIVLPLSQPHKETDGTLTGHILHIDHFGNLITNVNPGDLPEKEQPVKVEVGNKLITGLNRTYAEGENLLALIGSSGRLEIALKNGNASICLNVRVGDEVKIGFLS
ncbi:S-adenosyl-l-methionine hydroxide adenosyltransferase family protein, partial [Chloroflexota bacterium]